MPRRDDQLESCSTWNTRAEAEDVLSRLDSIHAAAGDAERQLERMSRLAMLGEISGFVAHEFNNILTPLLANAQVALRQPRDPARMALALERVVAGIRRATEVAESVMDLARSEAPVPRGTGAEDGRGGGALVSEAVREAAALVRDELAAHGLELQTSVEDGLMAGISCVDLGEVLLNLLLNARRASGRAGSRRIEIEGRSARVPRGTGGGSQLEQSLPAELRAESDQPVGTQDVSVVLVRDWAGGVDEGVLSMWGARGVRVRRGGDGGGKKTALESVAAKSGGWVCGGGSGGGAGLGMDVCVRLVSRAGGWIEVESEWGEGTVVRVVLPRVGGEMLNRA